MALRGFVTGSDMCTASDGAGPSNAMGTLADSILGRRAKEQERLQELPGVQGMGGQSALPFYPDSAQAAAMAAFEGDMAPIPGLAPAGLLGPGAVDEFLAGRPPPGMQQGIPGAPPHFAEFEQVFQQGRMERPVGEGHLTSGLPPPLTPFLHSFLDSARAHMAFQPLPLPAFRLTLEDQCRIRDRSTIVARHLYADRGDRFADEQVGRLLESLNIDQRALPQAHPGGAANWDAIFSNGAPTMADAAAAARLRNLAPPMHPPPGAHDARWAEEFSKLRLGEESAPQQWAESFAAQQAGGLPSWAEEFHDEQLPGGAWAAEFGKTLEEVEAATAAGTRTVDAEPALQNTRALAERLAADKDPKFQNSKFLNFVSKMSRGELIMEDNQVKEVAPSTATGQQWAEEFSANPPGAQADAATVQQWMGEFEQEHPGALPGGWADEFAEQFAAPAAVESWLNDWERDLGVAEATTQRDGEYAFAPNNPFLEDKDSYNKGVELFRRGVLSEAALALEAEVQRNPANVEAWRLLGTVHAENDDDQQAIAALQQALLADPGNAEVLLSLGVSYTNELDQRHALSYLHTWLAATHPQAVADSVPLTDASQRLRHALDTFVRAAEQSPGDADLHVAVGVLHSLAREYGGAVSAFRAALQLRPRDYSLWNKLGATLANSNNAAEAISAYQKALELKPNYMRAWTNMGISQANVGQYETSARYYIRALGLNARASNVWGYLRTSLACAGRMDLMQACEDENVDELTATLPL